MRKTNKKMIAIILAVILIVSFIPFNVFAVNSYTITFSVNTNAQNAHTIVVDEGHLKIDGQYVDPRLASAPNDNTFNGYSVTQTSANVVTMTITSGAEVVLNFNSGNSFELFANGNPVNAGTTFNAATEVAVQDYTNNNTNPPPVNPPVNGPVFNINCLNGKVWYKFNTETSETEVTGNRTNINIPDGARGITVRGENKTINHFEFQQNGQKISGNNDQEAFKGNAGVSYDITGNDTIDLVVEYANEQGQGGNNNQEPGQQGGPDNIEFDVKFTDTHVIMWVNDKNFLDDREGLQDTFKGTVEGAGFNANDRTNTIKVQNSFGDAPLIEITINGNTYKKGDNNVTIGQDNEFIVTVPGAAKYTITGKADPDFPLPRTIIWVNPNYVPKDAADAAWVKDFTIEHGYAKVIEVYDTTGKKLEPSAYISNQVQPDGSKSDNYGLNKGFGWVQVFKGYKVVFELEPEYGYQLTGIAINETPLKAIDNIINRFEVIIPEGNLHFAATYTKTEDIVKAKSKKVASGSVELGGGLASGSAQLTVDDVEISEDKKQEFTNAANGYTISDFLNISLYNVFYKGKADSEDVWSNEIEELDEYVTVSIQLEEGVNAEDIVIVHNIHDGKDYEVIEIESYDPETRILTFKTKSFSNYAIATKGEVKTTSNVNTGDNIAIFVAVFAVATVGAVSVIVLNKKV